MKTLRVVLASLALMLAAGRLSAQTYVVVVNSANPISTLDKSTLNAVFLKRLVRWEDGQVAAPVNLDRASATRDAFSRSVHGKSSAAVESYWQGQIFAGKETPPPTRASDADVIAYVRSKPSAIGYVSANAILGSEVKVVRIN